MSLIMRPRRASAVTLAAGTFLAGALFAGSHNPALSQEVDDLVQQQQQIVQRGQTNQQQVEQIDDQTSEITREYRSLLEQLETVQIYNRQLERLIADQEEERKSLQRQIDRVETIQRDITPLMLAMAEGFAEFVERDVPFLKNERSNRVERIEDLVGNANATNAEKFRRILEAYQIENEYGRTIESYRGELEDGRSVQFLRVGRLIFIYQTLDGEEAALWNQDTRQWEPLSGDYNLGIRQAIRIANQQVAPDLVVLPVNGPESAE